MGKLKANNTCKSSAACNKSIGEPTLLSDLRVENQSIHLANIKKVSLYRRKHVHK